MNAARGRQYGDAVGFRRVEHDSVPRELTTREGTNCDASATENTAYKKLHSKHQSNERSMTESGVIGASLAVIRQAGAACCRGPYSLGRTPHRTTHRTTHRTAFLPTPNDFGRMRRELMRGRAIRTSRDVRIGYFVQPAVRWLFFEAHCQQEDVCLCHVRQL
ncbi:hypothetical protein [Caballeronia sp. BR00000012568055]|uniref:hypothetical protein n=1 Tax=Caballeronia sp. BR00000012568055 TaxID=2918761 RepID=UPI0023F91EF6|nr:hypothetical protein [Caballeronia sp. BR00000012568055]